MGNSVSGGVYNKLGFMLTLALFVVSSCGKTSGKSSRYAAGASVSILNKNIGWVHGPCLAIRNEYVPAGTAVTVIRLTIPQQIVIAQVVGMADSSDACPPLLRDRAGINKENGRSFYRLETNSGPLDSMAVAVLPDIAQKVTTTAGIDLNDDGVVEHVGSCITGDGIRFFVSPRKTFDETTLWSDYYYLGYDNEPTCP